MEGRILVVSHPIELQRNLIVRFLEIEESLSNESGIESVYIVKSRYAMVYQHVFEQRTAGYKEGDWISIRSERPFIFKASDCEGEPNSMEINNQEPWILIDENTKVEFSCIVDSRVAIPSGKENAVEVNLENCVVKEVHRDGWILVQVPNESSAVMVVFTLCQSIALQEIYDILVRAREEKVTVSIRRLLKMYLHGNISGMAFTPRSRLALDSSESVVARKARALHIPKQFRSRCLMFNLWFFRIWSNLRRTLCTDVAEPADSSKSQRALWNPVAEYLNSLLRNTTLQTGVGKSFPDFLRSREVEHEFRSPWRVDYCLVRSEQDEDVVSQWLPQMFTLQSLWVWWRQHYWQMCTLQASRRRSTNLPECFLCTTPCNRMTESSVRWTPRGTVNCDSLAPILPSLLCLRVVSLKLPSQAYNAHHWYSDAWQATVKVQLSEHETVWCVIDREMVARYLSHGNTTGEPHSFHSAIMTALEQSIGLQTECLFGQEIDLRGMIELWMWIQDKNLHILGETSSSTEDMTLSTVLLAVKEMWLTSFNNSAIQPPPVSSQFSPRPMAHGMDVRELLSTMNQRALESLGKVTASVLQSSDEVEVVRHVNCYRHVRGVIVRKQRLASSDGYLVYLRDLIQHGDTIKLYINLPTNTEASSDCCHWWGAGCVVQISNVATTHIWTLSRHRQDSGQKEPMLSFKLFGKVQLSEHSTVLFGSKLDLQPGDRFTTMRVVGLDRDMFQQSQSQADSPSTCVGSHIAWGEKIPGNYGSLTTLRQVLDPLTRFLRRDAHPSSTTSSSSVGTTCAVSGMSVHSCRQLQWSLRCNHCFHRISRGSFIRCTNSQCLSSTTSRFASWISDGTSTPTTLVLEAHWEVDDGTSGETVVQCEDKITMNDSNETPSSGRESVLFVLTVGSVLHYLQGISSSGSTQEQLPTSAASVARNVLHIWDRLWQMTVAHLASGQASIGSRVFYWKPGQKGFSVAVPGVGDDDIDQDDQNDNEDSDTEVLAMLDEQDPDQQRSAAICEFEQEKGACRRVTVLQLCLRRLLLWLDRHSKFPATHEALVTAGNMLQRMWSLWIRSTLPFVRTMSYTALLRCQLSDNLYPVVVPPRGFTSAVWDSDGNQHRFIRQLIMQQDTSGDVPPQRHVAKMVFVPVLRTLWQQAPAQTASTAQARTSVYDQPGGKRGYDAMNDNHENESIRRRAVENDDGSIRSHRSEGRPGSQGASSSSNGSSVVWTRRRRYQLRCSAIQPLSTSVTRGRASSSSSDAPMSLETRAWQMLANISTRKGQK